MGLGIGAGEILLILVVALIIWGPARLPEIARTVGKAVRTLKKASFDLTNTVVKEIEKENPSPPKEAPGSQAKKPSPYPGTGSAGRSDDKPKKPEGQQQQNE